MIYAALALIAALVLNAARWWILIRRTRWLSLSLLLIYGYATSGEALWPALVEWSPTKTGLFEGAIQLTRLHCALAALSVLLSNLSQQQLMAGLYIFAYPLKFIAISRERLVVRLALTLSYAEKTMRNVPLHSLADFQKLFDHQYHAPSSIELQLGKLAWCDWAVLLSIGILLFGIWR